MDWWVGVLRPGMENVDWTAGGAEPSWAVARDRAIAALRELAGGEGVRQEYRIHVGDVPVMVWPGLHDDGTVDLAGLDAVLSLEADRA